MSHPCCVLSPDSSLLGHCQVFLCLYTSGSFPSNLIERAEMMVFWLIRNAGLIMLGGAVALWCLAFTGFSYVSWQAGAIASVGAVFMTCLGAWLHMVTSPIRTGGMLLGRARRVADTPVVKNALQKAREASAPYVGAEREITINGKTVPFGCVDDQCECGEDHGSQ